MSPRLPPGGRVISVGTDLVECARIAAIVARHGRRFLDKVFTAQEIACCAARADPTPCYAARFAAKEAVSKCFTTGIGVEFDWHTAAVVHGPRDQPLVVLNDRGRELLAAVGGSDILISLSHTRTHAIAVAVMVANP
jgi:holo-[acyl-carrier protein] synthase